MQKSALKWLFTIIALLLTSISFAEESETITIGMLTDMSGAYSDLDGTGGAQMAQWAIDDYGGHVLGRKVELISADHQNKPDVASTLARKWFDVNKIKMLIGGTNSAALLAMSSIANERSLPFIATGSAVSSLTNEHCNAYTIHYSPYDTYAASTVTMKALYARNLKSVFFIGADYTFGKSLVNQASVTYRALGGHVSGAVYAPLGTTDWGSFLLQAETAKPEVLAMANAGQDLRSAIQQANEFGIGKHMRIAGFTVTSNELDALSFATTKGLFLIDSWYWDQSDKARAISERFKRKFGRMPTSIQAADYSAVHAYLETVAKSNTTDGTAIMKTLKEIKINDFFNKGYIRADGRLMHDVYLYEVIAPRRSTEKYSLEKVATVSGTDAFLESEESKCPLLR